MKRKKPLKADPEKVREFLNRGRGSLSRASAGLKRSTGPKRGKGPPNPSRPPEGAEGVLRDRVWELDSGRCVGCGKRVGRHAGPRVWAAHHCLAKQTLRKRASTIVLGRQEFPARYGDLRAEADRLAEEWISDPDNCVLLCTKCHMNHESGGPHRVPAEKLPARVGDFAYRLGPWAEDLLHRSHPSQDQPNQGGRT